MASVNVYPVPRKNATKWKVQWREAAHQASKTFDTEEEANDFAIIKKAELVSGRSFDAQPGKVVFKDYWQDEFLPYYLSKRSPKTAASYRQYYKNLLEPYFGTRPINAIKKATLKQWVRWTQDRRPVPSPHSVREAFVVLRSVLTRAVNDDLILVNPCARMGDILPDLPPKRRAVTLSIPDVRVLSETVDSYYTALILLLGTHGLRPSEALALTVGDVHLTGGWVWVDKAVVNVEGVMTPKATTKTGAVRRVELFGCVKDALDRHLQTLGDLDDRKLLFPGKHSGGYLHMDYLRKLVREAGDKLGFVGLQTYDLKRSAATNLLVMTNNNLKWVQEQLGHSRYSMSLLHTQTTTGMSAQADAAMTAAFNRKSDDDITYVDRVTTA